MTQIAINLIKKPQKNMLRALLYLEDAIKWVITVLNVGINIGKGLTKLGKVFVWGNKRFRNRDILQMPY